MSKNTLHHDEGGRISIFFVFGTIAFIFLIALIYNTAHQSIRKIEMQGAADAAAIAGGTQAARDLNDIANNNNTMSEMLTVMIALRSLLQTVEILRDATFYLAKILEASVFLSFLAPPVEAFSAVLRVTATILKPIDRAICEPSRGVGWLSMKALDALNVGIKTDFPIWAELETRDFAKRNGADRGLYGVLMPRESPAVNLLPWLPAARGRHLEILDRAEATYLKYVQPLPGAIAAAFAFLLPNPISIFFGMVEYNKASLRGGKLGSILTRILNFGFKVIFSVTDPLKWPKEPPRPMLLTDQPSLTPAATMEVKESTANLSKVRKHLQYLAIATGKMSSGSRIGGEHFLNVAPYQSLSYAEADVYNPTRWSLWEQNWRVKLAPSVVLNEKINQLAGIFGIRSIPQSFNGLAFANNH